jgi:amino acid transporter/mannitol/fructose-specific phosphotransferase system IIA component (Ntr-type)
MFGTIDGVGVWLALVLKCSIALIGLGAYLNVYLGIPMKVIALVFCVVFMLANFFGAKEAAGIQTGMVGVLLAILAFLVFKGIPSVESKNLSPFAPFGMKGLLPTTALVFISYIGLTKVASVSEEVKDPERNIPLGMGLSLFVVMIIYAAVVFVVVGVVPAEDLYYTLTPVSDAGRRVIGKAGVHIICIAAILAFATTANAGILAASRYLLAMSRDRVIPHPMSRFSRFKTPMNAIFLTSSVIMVITLTVGVEQIAKLASTFQLIVFALVNVSVIVMRESGIESYDPGFKSPFYPYTQVAGILIAVVLIPELGLLSSIFAFGLVGLGIVWHSLYARHRVSRVGAVAQMAQRVAERLLAKDASAMGLNKELREILKEKGLRSCDPFVQMAQEADLLEIESGADSEQIIEKGAEILAQRSGISKDLILGALLQRNRLGETPAEAGVALPHLQLDGVKGFYMVACRSLRGIDFPMANQSIHAVFLLLSNRDNPSQHLRFLANIARLAENPKFLDQWIKAKSLKELRNLLLEGPDS